MYIKYIIEIIKHSQSLLFMFLTIYIYIYIYSGGCFDKVYVNPAAVAIRIYTNASELVCLG